jgi:5-methylcytosine-specific restriction endonuclease McrA
MILSYKEFILEKESFVSSKSNSGSTVEKDIVYNYPETSKSPSQRVYLRNLYQKREFVDLLDKLTKSSNISKSQVKKIVKTLHTKNPKHLENLIRSVNNYNFLKKKQKLEGELHCEYCDKHPLKIYYFGKKFKTQDGATVDHRNPVSKGGKPYDESNMAVSCYKCNQQKADMNYEDWLEILKNKNRK